MGLSRSDGEWLQNRLLDVVREEATLINESRFGRLYMIDFQLETVHGAAIVKERLDCENW